MKIKHLLTSSAFAFMLGLPTVAIAAPASTPTAEQHANPLAIPLQAHTAKDMWESYFNQCWGYDFVDKNSLEASLKTWQKRNANRWQIYWLLLEQAAEDNQAFQTSYLNFKKQSLARAKQQAKMQHDKVDAAGKAQLCEQLVVMLNDPRSDLPEDSSKKTQKEGQEGVAVIGK